MISREIGIVRREEANEEQYRGGKNIKGKRMQGNVPFLVKSEVKIFKS